MSNGKAVAAGKVVFQGSLTFANAESLRGALAEALEAESVEIAFGDVRDVDLSFLQLLCAALRTAAETSREITVAAGPVPHDVSSMVMSAGMVSPLGRREDGFWNRLAGENGCG
jgi:ABC-type transporter Mla MlaB component